MFQAIILTSEEVALESGQECNLVLAEKPPEAGERDGGSALLVCASEREHLAIFESGAGVLFEAGRAVRAETVVTGEDGTLVGDRVPAGGAGLRAGQQRGD